MKLKALIAAAALSLFTASQALAAPIPFLTGPIDVSGLLGVFNTLIQSINNAGSNPASQGGIIQYVSPRNMATCGVVGLVNNTATANAAATDTYITEIFVPAFTVTTGVAVLNGTTAASNSTIYLADAYGNQIAHTASTAVAGASVYQLIPWTAVVNINGPASYYLYFQNSGTTNTWETINNAACGTLLKTGTVYGTFPVLTPPTTFVTAQGPIGSLY